MMPRLPPLKAIQALEAVARLGSVHRAAEELNLTRSAVSHQLRSLEDAVGCRLTSRQARGLGLTPQGERYVREARSALRVLGRAQESTAGMGVAGRLTVSCTPGFATYWLCPNVGGFTAEYPNVDLTIVLPPRLDDVTSGGVDLFIAYGQGDWVGMRTELLASLEFWPVCSPLLLNRGGGLASPRDLGRFTLLHLADQNDWARWLTAADVIDIDADHGIVFSDMHLVQSAAIAGQGVAMGDSLVSSEALASGTLVRPFPMSIPAPAAYYLVAAPESVDDPIAQTFVDWLRRSLARIGVGPDASATAR